VFRILLTLLFFTTSAHANSNSWGSWQEVEALRQSGQSAQALELLGAHPSDDPAYDYNIGTLYLDLGENGKAVAFLDRANHRLPRKESIQHNLRLARERLQQALGEGRLDPASSTIESLLDQVPRDEIRGVIGLLLLLLVAFAFRNYRKNRSLIRVFKDPACGLTEIALAITVSIWLADSFALRFPPAFTLASTTIRSGPGSEFSELSRLVPGVKLRLTGTRSNAQNSESGPVWVQVRFSPDHLGWVEDSALLKWN
jgi:hypothetical protein